jgi:hypothetical protein
MSSLILGGDTSGTITLTVPTAAGTNTITLPASTGTAITTASTSGIPNTVNWTTVQTSSVSPASAGVGYPMDTTAGALTVTLPAAPVAGNMISIVDYAGTAATGTILTTASTSIPGTVNWTTVQTSSVSPAVAGTGYPMNTTSGALTVTLPAAPTAGNMISIVDYAGTAATNNITINPNGLKIQGSTSSATISTNREAINLVYVDATQVWLAYADVYSTTAPLPQTYTASYLVVAGGGGGGYIGGGGGAGGFLSGSVTLTSGTTYTATVGSGGPNVGSATPGGNSVLSGSGISTVTGLGGGYGGAGPGQPAGKNGGSGGSGGGAGENAGIGTAGSGTPGQGNNGGGGFASGSNIGCGGGGGAGAVGGTGSPGLGGNGGNGSASSITGTPASYAGGGGGASYSGTSGTGGTGGGGNASTSGTSVAGTANTGGGGGGGGSVAGANGGSGVVILSVPTASYSGTTTGSPTITTSGANTIIKYTSGSGTYTA